MQKRYLLYVDILGFKELVTNHPSRVTALYNIIDELNVHDHANFDTTVFSDTILVHTKDNLIKSKKNREKRYPLMSGKINLHSYFVMYSCEFAQDLLYRLIGTGIAFRGVVTYGEMDHYQLKHANCFFGRGLNQAYYWEQQIKCTGLFIDNEALKANDIFPVARYNDDLSYVFVNQTTEYLQRNFYKGTVDGDVVDAEGQQWDVAKEAMLLKEIHDNAVHHPMPEVRAKYLAAWNFQYQRYPKLLQVLAEGNFHPAALIPNGIKWEKVLRHVRKHHLERID